MSIVLLDVDGTIADCEHRRHHVVNTPKDWDAFFEKCHLDPPIEDVIKVGRILWSSGETVVIVTARGEEYRKPTEEWIDKHYGRSFYTRIWMRKAGDYRADHIVKKEILDEITEWYKEKPWLAIDDRPTTCAMWRQNGITVMRVGEFKSKCVGNPNYYIMCGPSGGGKTTLIKNDPVLSKCFYVGSDNIREILCKDFKDQTKNAQVFEAAHEIVRTALLAGLDVVLDSTALRDADRKKAALNAPEGAKVHYVVCDRPLEDKKASGDWRNYVTIKGKTLVESHDQTFRSNLSKILNGDGFEFITVIDRRS